MEVGDGQSIINHFKEKQSEDRMFFYSVQVNQDNRIASFFFGEMVDQNWILTLLGMLLYLTPLIEPISTT